MSANKFSVNESLMPSYGRHGTKQFVRGKLIRFGFKLWCLCSPDGYLIHAEPYSGKDTNLPETGLGQGSDVALGMIEKFDLTKWSTVAMNNFFTTSALHDKLMDMDMCGVGTIRENRLQGVPLKKKATLQRETRGTFDCTSDGNNFLAAKRDNKGATNYLSLNPVLSTKCWSKVEKKHVDVPMPNPFKKCNANMGGVDLFDQFVSTYPVRIYSKKWW